MNALEMLSLLFEGTGLIVWVGIVIFTMWLIPLFGSAVALRLLNSVAEKWSATFLPPKDSRRRYRAYAELRERRYWRTHINAAIARVTVACRWIFNKY